MAGRLIVSPSPRRAWIEISDYVFNLPALTSPSPRRAWIEICLYGKIGTQAAVALPSEGVD